MLEKKFAGNLLSEYWSGFRINRGKLEKFSTKSEDSDKTQKLSEIPIHSRPTQPCKKSYNSRATVSFKLVLFQALRRFNII
jgi:hypothetical protein